MVAGGSGTGTTLASQRAWGPGSHGQGRLSLPGFSLSSVGAAEVRASQRGPGDPSGRPYILTSQSLDFVLTFHSAIVSKHPEK